MPKKFNMEIRTKRLVKEIRHACGDSGDEALEIIIDEIFQTGFLHGSVEKEVEMIANITRFLKSY